MSAPYDEGFYREHSEGALRSARAVVPLLIELVAPDSVVDVGCGTGTWLAVFREQGVKEIFGLDASRIGREQLEIPEKHFLVHDLAEPIELDVHFDLVLCLEVAEHLPESAAETLISNVTRLGPVVAFSAAIPMQGGTGHQNEQWPEYWVDRFEAHDYAVADAIRPRVWTRSDVQVWYAQNLLLFVSRAQLQARSSLRDAVRKTRREHLSLVHPQLFEERARKHAKAHAAYEWYAKEAEQYKTQVANFEALMASQKAQAKAFRRQLKSFRDQAEAFELQAAGFREQLESAALPGKVTRHAIDPAREDAEGERNAAEALAARADALEAELKTARAEIAEVRASALERATWLEERLDTLGRASPGRPAPAAAPHEETGGSSDVASGARRPRELPDNDG